MNRAVRLTVPDGLWYRRIKGGLEPLLRVRVDEEAGALWSLEGSWLRLWEHSTVRVPFLHPAWMQSWWKHYGADRRMHLVSVWDGADRMVGLAALCGGGSSPGTLEWIGGTELADALDLLVWPGEEMAVLALIERHLDAFLGQGAWLDLHFVPAESLLLIGANDMMRGGWDVEVTREEVSPWVSLQTSWEAFLEQLSKKDRHEIRRKMRKAAAALQPEFRMLEDDRGWQEAMNAFIHLHRVSQPQKALFMDPRRKAFFDDMGKAMAREGILRLAWVESRGKPIASVVSFVYGKTWGLYNSGFDPEYREFSPGIVLVAHTIQRAIEEGLEVYDFLRGPEPYKYDFGAKDRDLFRLRLSPRRRDDS